MLFEGILPLSLLPDRLGLAVVYKVTFMKDRHPRYKAPQKVRVDLERLFLSRNAKGTVIVMRRCPTHSFFWPHLVTVGVVASPEWGGGGAAFRSTLVQSDPAVAVRRPRQGELISRCPLSPSSGVPSCCPSRLCPRCALLGPCTPLFLLSVSVGRWQH